MSIDDTTICISIEEMRNFLQLELMYHMTQQQIDSMIIMQANCDTIASVAMRSLNRERSEREQAEAVISSLIISNKRLNRQRRLYMTTSLVLLSATLTAILVRD